MYIQGCNYDKLSVVSITCKLAQCESIVLNSILLQSFILTTQLCRVYPKEPWLVAWSSMDESDDNNYL